MTKKNVQKEDEDGLEINNELDSDEHPL